ncbi:sigma-54-dependent Fis family transcriptional regulator [Alteromonas sediminis]|uniref:Sigma-54-dependent Fis family transcriptional regulator n=1 Tax=Alteromonas sediminis TaxID=2259342 RepID=A0A3N5YLE2_9ALTE|nr:sigma-54 dependent transcriptional regulator [Alteromonas sediminis]RPJ65921.1 sigma-54-dependent Fis family transcriptional regulator [Alteromonas sediminis]
MKQPGRILLVDDEEDILVAGKLLLKRHFEDVEICNRPENIPKLLGDFDFDAILLDMNFGPGESSGQQGYLWLEKILSIEPQAVVIMITAHGGVDVAVDAMKRGATDFISKPWQNDKVVSTVSTAVKLGRSRTEASALRHTNKCLAQLSNQHAQPIISQSAKMKDVLSVVQRSAPTDANVLILGENGTGKEVIARAIHSQSQRGEQVFITVDLGAVSESLFESELFGHKKGAFTGANEDRIGRIQAAEGGTLFLDEVGNLPLHLQAKLLAVLAQREITPLGANKPVPFNVRIVAATNTPKQTLLDDNLFRRDLLYRLNTVEVTLPPLREREEDIAIIAEHYLAYYSRKYHKSELSLDAGAIEVMRRYQWPGNIRELQHVVERAVILCQSSVLTSADLQLAAHDQTVSPPAEKAPSASVGKEPTDDVGFNLEDIEKQTIARALKTYRYNISHAAKALGLTRAALYRRMEKYGF